MTEPGRNGGDILLRPSARSRAVVARIDRLAENLAEGIRTLQYLHDQGIYIRALPKGLDTGDGRPHIPPPSQCCTCSCPWPSGRGTPSGAGSGPAWTAPRPRAGPGAGHRRWTPRSSGAVRDFLETGGSVSAAARAFGVSRPTVGRRCGSTSGRLSRS